LTSWRKRSVLVTGAYGFIGSWLAERLLAEGARVVTLRRDAGAGSRLRTDGIEAGCDIVDADLVDYDSLVRVLHEFGIDAVFHLAGQSVIEIANRSPMSTLESNIRGTYTLLEACRGALVVGAEIDRIVVASSDKAYGNVGDEPYDESRLLDPSYPYDTSKSCADMIARMYAASFGLPVAVARLANVYGGGDTTWTRLVPDTARSIIGGERPVIRSDGTPERDFLYVEDAVDAYLAVSASLERPDMHGRAWNAGAGAPTPVLELVKRLIAVSGKDLEPEVGSGSGEVNRRALDSSAIRAELGWKPRWDLDRGLAETYAWYERHLSGKAAAPAG
jgi:CDP-glucose 4,6-dehydratase